MNIGGESIDSPPLFLILGYPRITLVSLRNSCEGPGEPKLPHISDIILRVSYPTHSYIAVENVPKVPSSHGFRLRGELLASPRRHIFVIAETW